MYENMIFLQCFSCRLTDLQLFRNSWKAPIDLEQLLSNNGDWQLL
jgi:hypothetical protein